ncbi:MAG: hybrid sensor histidine kinase/response regulator, partial [Ketobacter sp.]
YNRALAELTVNPSVLDGQLDLVKQELVIRMALALDVARAGIWLHAENGRELHCIALFERKTETCTEGFVLKQSEYPRYFEAMLQNAHVSVFDAQSDPRTSEFGEGYLKPLGITSMLDAVIPGGSGVVGVICAEHIGPRRNWTQPEEAFVISLATLVGGVYASHERKQTERRLVQATRDAEMAARAKSDFLATMSHEIRTPMNGVLGMLNLLPDQELNPDQRRKVDIAKKSATNLLSLLDDILDFSKVEAGKLDLVQVDFDLRALLDDLAASFALRAQSKGLELVMDLSGVDVSSVHGDPDRLRQIFSNLMSNAVKFTDRGEVVVRCRLEPEPKGYRLLAKVLDSGIGIPKAKQDKLFSPFVQVDASTTRKYGGTGLGLAICRKLCELMGGQINVTSAEGHGTAFSFAVYLQQSEHFESVAPELPAKGFRLLLVDQQARSRETLAKQFNAWGIEVEDVDSSRNALLRLGRADFDLVMVDVADPDYEVFARRLPAEFNGLLCLMTRFDSQLDAAALSAAGYQAYLHKPTSTCQLLQAIALAQLPRAGEDEARLLLGQESNGRGAAGEVLLWPQGSRVLLVEDNRINQEVATLMLNAMGLSVDVAENGLRALEQLSHGAAAYNLILMDCQMPEMDGYQATRCIRAGEAGNAYRDIPIIALTANALKGDRQRCLEAGMLDYLTKPIEESRLRELLARYLNPTCSAAEVSGEVIPRAETEWDQAAALKMVRGRQDRLSDLLRIFFDSMPERHQRLDNALICQDLEEVRKVAHSIKGSAGQLHAHSLQDQAGALELAAREGDWQRVEGVLPPFYEAETRFLQQIKNYID